jgi:hypothetical protein
MLFLQQLVALGCQLCQWYRVYRWPLMCHCVNVLHLFFDTSTHVRCIRKLLQPSALVIRHDVLHTQSRVGCCRAVVPAGLPAGQAAAAAALQRCGKLAVAREQWQFQQWQT